MNIRASHLCVWWKYLTLCHQPAPSLPLSHGSQPCPSPPGPAHRGLLLHAFSHPLPPWLALSRGSQGMNHPAHLEASLGNWPTGCPLTLPVKISSFQISDEKGVIPTSSPLSQHVWSQWPENSVLTQHRMQGLAPSGSCSTHPELGLLLSPTTWPNWPSYILENKNQPIGAPAATFCRNLNSFTCSSADRAGLGFLPVPFSPSQAHKLMDSKQETPK